MEEGSGLRLGVNFNGAERVNLSESASTKTMLKGREKTIRLGVSPGPRRLKMLQTLAQENKQEAA